MLSVLLYLVLVSLLLGLRPGELLDIRQLLLVLAGGMILYLPGMGKEDFKKWRNPDFELLARDMVFASFIETFVLLFIMLSNGGGTEQAGQEIGEGRYLARLLMKNIALNLRPLLYGVCIWIAMGSGMEGKADGGREEKEEKVWTAQEAYQSFYSLGLTRREAEIAVQISKGMSNKEIALELNISEATVKKHISNIFEKLGIEKRQEIRERLTL